MVNTIMTVLGNVVGIYYWAILLYIISSWIPALSQSSFGEMLKKIVEPYLSIFRRFIPPLGMIDLSPIIAIIAYRILTGFVLDGARVVLELFL